MCFLQSYCVIFANRPGGGGSVIENSNISNLSVPDSKISLQKNPPVINYGVS